MIDDFTTFKEELKSRVDIVDIVGEYVELKRRGTNHIGLCPFHNEKTPSFSVNQASQFYHCFGCGKGGDVISFMMDISGMTFIETIGMLAERVGLQVPQSRTFDPSVRDRKDRLIAANIAAAEFFHTMLSSDEGKAACDYLAGRGLKQETIRTFRLGFAPETSSALIEFAEKKKVDKRDLEEAGVIMPGRYGGSSYSRFGGRVIFPITDQMTRIIGFGGRLLEGDGAKYLNSPDSPVYHKSQVLFGIHQAKDPIKKTRRAIVVEGYMDAISLHQAGINNVIAASGTAFTPEQGKIIARMAREATLLFDGDRAGMAAAARGADNLLSTDLLINVVMLPEGHDPDSYVNENGVDALRKLLDNPMDIWEFKLHALTSDDVDINDRTRIAGEVAESISLIPDDIKRDLYIRKMSAPVGVDINSMRKAVEGRIRRRMRRGAVAAKDAAAKQNARPDGEKRLLGYIIAYPNLARHFMEEAGARPFTDPVMAKIAEEIFNRLVEGLEVSPSALMSSLSDQHAQEMVASVAILEKDEEHASKCIEDNIRRLKEFELKEEIVALDRALLCESDMEKKRKLLEKRDELIERKTTNGY